VRALLASRAAGVRRRRHLVGAGCFKRQTSSWRPLHLLRAKGRDAPAARLGRQSYRFYPFPMSIADENA
jgi:hypothetical protein